MLSKQKRISLFIRYNWLFCTCHILIYGGILSRIYGLNSFNLEARTLENSSKDTKTKNIQNCSKEIMRQRSGCVILAAIFISRVLRVSFISNLVKLQKHVLTIWSFFVQKCRNFWESPDTIERKIRNVSFPTEIFYW